MPKMRMVVDLSEGDLSDILCAAFEGGIGYWVKGYSSCPKQGTSPECGYMAPASGGVVRLVTEDDDTFVLTQYRLLSGIARAAIEGRFKLGEDFTGDIDADIADVIIQYAVMDEIRYG